MCRWRRGTTTDRLDRDSSSLIRQDRGFGKFNRAVRRRSRARACGEERWRRSQRDIRATKGRRAFWSGARAVVAVPTGASAGPMRDFRTRRAPATCGPGRRRAVRGREGPADAHGARGAPRAPDGASPGFHHPAVGDRPDPHAPAHPRRDGGPSRRAESALDAGTVRTECHATLRRGPPGPRTLTPTPRRPDHARGRSVCASGTFGVRVSPPGRPIGSR